MTPPTAQEVRAIVGDGLIVKPFEVSVVGWPSGGGAPYYASSRGKALAQAWRCDAFEHLSFGEFLKIARAARTEAHDRFGEAITVGGKRAFLVSYNRQYIQFVRPGSDVVMNSHPLDVEPPEARRGTPYYTEVSNAD